MVYRGSLSGANLWLCIALGGLPDAALRRVGRPPSTYQISGL